MKIKSINNKMALVKSMDREYIERVGKLFPDALVLKDKDGNPEFKMELSDRGQISKYGVAFDGQTEDGSACCILEMKDGLTTESLVDEWGKVFISIDKVEAQLRDAATDMADMESAIEEMLAD